MVSESELPGSFVEFQIAFRGDKYAMKKLVVDPEMLYGKGEECGNRL